LKWTLAKEFGSQDIFTLALKFSWSKKLILTWGDRDAWVRTTWLT